MAKTNFHVFKEDASGLKEDLNKLLYFMNNGTKHTKVYEHSKTVKRDISESG
jgi:hypothetical protein